jgi:hypothetical protein
LTQGRRWWTTPVWIGEFGTCHPDDDGCAGDPWWSAFLGYLQAGDVDWTYWSINGTSARGSAEPVTCGATPRSPGCAEGYGVSDPTWSKDASPTLSAALRSAARASQGP